MDTRATTCPFEDCRSGPAAGIRSQTVSLPDPRWLWEHSDSHRGATFHHQRPPSMRLHKSRQVAVQFGASPPVARSQPTAWSVSKSLPPTRTIPSSAHPELRRFVRNASLNRRVLNRRQTVRTMPCVRKGVRARRLTTKFSTVFDCFRGRRRGH